MASRSGSLKLSSTVRLRTPSGHVEMPLLGLGVFQSQNAVVACTEAFKLGYRHGDTARYYGNETEVGEAVRSSGIDRSTLFLTSKVMGAEHGYATSTKAVESSLDKLGPGAYWDCFLLHDPTAGKQRRIEAYRALADAQKSGKVKVIGVSNYGIHHLEELEAAKVGPTPAINQIELHPWCQQRPLVDYCNSKGIVVQAYCPIVRGKYHSDPTLTSIASKTGKTPAQVLIRWSLQKGFVPLPKSDNPARIRENADVYDFQLDAEDMKSLDALGEGEDQPIAWHPQRGP